MPQLPTQLVMSARRKELDYFESKNVWKRVSVPEALRIGGRSPTSVWWVDVNKGDDECPDIRSRLVARQIRAQAGKMVSLRVCLLQMTFSSD